MGQPADWRSAGGWAEPVAFNQSQSRHDWPNKIGFFWCDSFVLVPTFKLAKCVEFLLPINGVWDSIIQCLN